ncbi:MAG: hypothetical protein MZV63_25010 [Marinilabiliales bacterium]|nr:hypothetical protein [Marinilabiliales bacterium]
MTSLVFSASTSEERTGRVQVKVHAGPSHQRYRAVTSATVFAMLRSSSLRSAEATRHIVAGYHWYRVMRYVTPSFHCRALLMARKLGGSVCIGA